MDKLITLKPTFQTFEYETAQVRFQSVTLFGLYALAVPNGGTIAFQVAMKDEFAIAELPQYGRFIPCLEQHAYFFQFRPQLYMLFIDNLTMVSEKIQQLENASYISDQSSGYCAIIADGVGLKHILMRLFSKDFSDSSFPVESFAPAKADHLAVNVLRVSRTHYLFLSPRSTQNDLYHLFRLTADNTINE